MRNRIVTVEEIRDTLKKRFPLLEKEIKIIKVLEKSRVLIQDKYGVLNVSKLRLLKGTVSTIESAVDKNEYYKNRANEVHGYKFDYSKVNYINNNIKIIITCLEHGTFEQNPRSHLEGKGCAKCNGNGRYTLEECITLIKEHQPKALSNIKIIEYNNNHNIIVEDKHGLLKTNIKSLLAGNLPNIKTAISVNEYAISKLKELFGERYDCSKVEYKSFEDYITLICSHHGDFEKSFGNLMSGVGCPTCSRLIGSTYNNKKVESIENAQKIPCSFYVMEVSNNEETFWKVGISYKPTIRANSISSESNYKVRVLLDDQSNLFSAFSLEQYLLKKYKKYKYIPTYKFQGYTECFKINPLEHFEELKETKNDNTNINIFAHNIKN